LLAKLKEQDAEMAEEIGSQVGKDEAGVGSGE
jgi:hypothetical protein